MVEVVKDVVVALAMVLVPFILVLVLVTSVWRIFVPVLTQVTSLALVASNARSLVSCVDDKGVTNDNIALLKAVASDGHRKPVSPEF